MSETASRNAARDDARLAASISCVGFYIEHGTTDVTVARLAEAAGISQRTFHRYFPIKAESVAPVFEWMTVTFEQSIVSAPADRAILDVLRDAMEVMLHGEFRERTAPFFSLVFADAEMWSVFLRKLHDGEHTLIPVLTSRLGSAPTTLRARSAAAAVATATRLALESMVTDGADPVTQFELVIETFSPGLLTT